MYYQLIFSIMITIAIILLIVWLLAIIADFTIGGYVHILFGVAILLVLYRIIRGSALDISLK